MVLRRRFGVTAVAGLAAAALMAGIAGCGSSSSSGSSSPASTSNSSSSTIKIGVDLTYNNTAFWSAYINYEVPYATQYARPAASGRCFRPRTRAFRTRRSRPRERGREGGDRQPRYCHEPRPAINYAAKHDVQLVSVDTIVGVGKVYMVVRASNLLYGEDACAYFEAVTSQVRPMCSTSRATSRHLTEPTARTGSTSACRRTPPNVTVLGDPTVWVAATAMTDTQTALNAYGTQLMAIYSQWSGPIPDSRRFCSARGEPARCHHDRRRRLRV